MYVARSPYRTGFSTPKVKIAFPRIASLFKGGFGKTRRIDRAQNFNQRVAVGQNLVLAPVFAHSGSGKVAAKPGKSFAQIVEQFREKTINYEVGPNTVMFGLMFFAAILSMLYLLHFNQVATKGYDINRLDASHSQLLSQWDVRNMQLAQIKSLNYILGSGRIDGMRTPDKVQYVNGGMTAVASLN